MQFPHCDASVLHKPGECEYCDQHSDWQYLREVWGINYTGHHEPGMMTCPAEMHRDIERIEQWSGNVPMQNGQWVPRVDPEDVESTKRGLLGLAQKLQRAVIRDQRSA